MTPSIPSQNPDQNSPQGPVQLEPETKAALHGLNPELVWSNVLDQIALAVEDHYREAEQVRTESGLNLTLEGLQVTLEQMSPEEGLNLLLSVCPHLDLSRIRQISPLTVLRGAAEIFTRSEELAVRQARQSD